MDKKSWLLILAICFASGSDSIATGSQSIATGSQSSDWFSEEAQSRGLVFRHYHGGTGDYYLPESLGSGVALIDYDGDGDLDIYLLQGTALNPARSGFRPPAASASNRLFRNMLAEEKSLRFVDVTAKAGVAAAGYSLGAAVGDYDNDGHPDLFVTGVNRTILYRNQGDGRFSDATKEAGLMGAGVMDSRISTAAAFFDADRDGDLDLLVLSYVDFTVATNMKCPDARNRLDYCQPAVYHPLPARYFRNDGAGHFSDQSQASGFGSAAGAGLGIAIADFNHDGWLDVYVANDGTPNHLWINRREGRFEETALTAGVAYDDQGRAQAGMGVAAADFDGDGDEDLAVANLMGEGLSLYQNDGQAEFRHVTAVKRLTAASLPFTGFGLGWADFDHDGQLDLFVANGSVKMLDLPGAYPYGQRNQLFRQNGGVFEEIRTASLAVAEASRGAALGDLDQDGDLDIVVNNSNGPVRLLLNRKPPPGQSVTVVLAGGNAEGARVGLFRGGRPPLWRRSSRAGSYLSANSPEVHFGVGGDVDHLEVEWPDGLRQRVAPIKAGRVTVERVR